VNNYIYIVLRHTVSHNYYDIPRRPMIVYRYHLPKKETSINDEADLMSASANCHDHYTAIEYGR